LCAMGTKVKPLPEALERRVHKMLGNGAEADEVAQVLIKKGWEPDDARAAAEREDSRYQKALRHNNMSKTHGPRANLVRTGSKTVGILVALWAALKLLRLFLAAD
jgi:hypothetical protein